MDTVTTADVIAGMLGECTGRHILDSGGAYGRHWERNAGITSDMWDAAPSATVDRYGCVTVSTFHYLRDRLSLHVDLDAMFREFAAGEDRTDTPHMVDMVDWVAGLLDVPEDSLRVWNTYNGEDYLSQVIQGITFEHEDDWYTVMHTHNGADVRGGYSSPRVFRVEVDMAEYFPYDNADASLYCTACDWAGDLRCGEFCDREGRYGSLELGESEDGDAVCPECGGKVGADAAYPMM
jgi:hypothetical protein